MKKLLNVGCGQRFHPDWVNLELAGQPGGISADVRKGLPFADDTFDVVYHAHVLEHLPRRDARPFLSECLRVLSPGGILRVGVPDLERIARLYLAKLEDALAATPDAEADYDWMVIEMLDQAVRDQPGGEMAAYLEDPRIPNPAFVIERIGEEGRTIMENAATRSRGPRHALHREPSFEDVVRFRRSGEVHRWMYDRFSLGRALELAGFVDPRMEAAGSSAIPAFSSYGLELDPSGAARKPDTLFMEARKPLSPCLEPAPKLRSVS